MTSWVKIPGICIIGLSLQSNLVSAGECNFIELVKNKSPGTETIKNQCSNENGLTIASELSLAAGGRIWIRSVHNEASAQQQVICQNRSLATIDLKITQLQAPWVSITNVDNCDSWKGNRLSCDIAQGQKVFCISAKLKQSISKDQVQERTTSVAMRNSKKKEGGTVKGLLSMSGGSPANIIAYTNTVNTLVMRMQPEIDLCRQLFQMDKAVQVRWDVSPSGKVSESSILSKENNYGQCLQNIVSSYVYPKSLTNMSFIYQF